MPIEFYCPGCGKLMRTPDATAGRKGQCPQCGTKVQIPISSVANAETASPAASPTVSPAAPAASGAASPGAGTQIRFACNTCNRTLSVPSSNAGKQARCPGCNSVTQIPAASTLASPKAAAPAAPNQFTCPSCKKTIRIPASAAGGRGKCPHCGAVVTLPGSSSGLTPIGSAGLTPLPSGGLTPLPSGGLNDLFSDLPGAGGAASDPFGGMGGDPLMGGGAPASFSPGNPYESSYAPSRSRSAGHEKKPKRSGLPWDRKDEVESAFGSTVKMVLFSPTQAFYKMHRTGGLGGPLQFCVSGAMLGTVISLVYNFAFQIVMLLIVISRAQGELPLGQIAMRVGISIGGGIVGGLIASAIGAVIGAFLYGGLFHLCLAAIGGANHTFETTFRVVCYSLGATAMYQLIPGCGGLVGAVSFTVTMIIGLYAAHETSGGKAALAVLLPAIVCAVVCGLIIFSLLSAFHLMGGVPAPPPGA
jgi:DNA-directed RNA polymerase subunit RPC12/RpoP